MNLEKEYQSITEAVVPHIPDGWTSAFITARLADGSIQCEFDYIDATGEEHWFEPGFRASIEICEALRAVRGQLDISGDCFTEARFHLRPDGTSDLQWGYAEQVAI